MKPAQSFVRNSFIGGVLVLLPLVILGYFFTWVFDFVTNRIQPITNLVTRGTVLPELVGDVFVISLIALFCFIIGTIVSTGAGRLAHGFFDEYLTKRAPGYKLVREIVVQLFGNDDDSPFRRGEVCRAQIFGPQIPTTVTGIVTSLHKDGFYTVFVPTGPNPTSGFFYHLPPECVELLPSVKVDAMIKTVIACGSGTAELFDQGGSTSPEWRQANKSPQQPNQL